MPSDREILRDLGRKVLEIANSPVNLERRRLWIQLNGLRGRRPMILAEEGGVFHETAPKLECRCEDEWARGVEHGLLWRIFHFEEIADDLVIDPWLSVGWNVSISDYGVQKKTHRPEGEGMGSCTWDHPIRDIARDFHLLKPRTFSVDRDATFAAKARLEEVFDGIFPVRLTGGYWWSMGLTWPAIDLIGLENLMLYMYDDPEGLHRIMSFLHDDHLALAQWAEKEGLLSLNNRADYIGSGGHGYCDDLPQRDWKEGDPVRLKDLWVLSESQETVGVGPELFEEFIFPYQLSLAERFGLTYYGCCEPVHTRWEVIKKIPNLRAVSISPWCDQEEMAAGMGRDYVFCRKPNPTLISTERFDEDLIRDDIRHTLTAAKDCNVSFAMKDVHTVRGDLSRISRWVQLTREVIDEFYS